MCTTTVAQVSFWSLAGLAARAPCLCIPERPRDHCMIMYSFLLVLFSTVRMARPSLVVQLDSYILSS